MAEEVEKGSAVMAAEAVRAVEAAEEQALAGLSKGARARRMREMLQEQHEAAEQEPADQRVLREAVNLIQMHERARQNRIQSNNRESAPQPQPRLPRPAAPRAVVRPKRMSSVAACAVPCYSCPIFRPRRRFTVWRGVGWGGSQGVDGSQKKTALGPITRELLN